MPPFRYNMCKCTDQKSYNFQLAIGKQAHHSVPTINTCSGSLDIIKIMTSIIVFLMRKRLM